MIRTVALRRELDVVRARKPRVGAPKHAKNARSSGGLASKGRVIIECTAQRAAISHGWRQVRGWWGGVYGAMAGKLAYDGIMETYDIGCDEYELRGKGWHKGIGS